MAEQPPGGYAGKILRVNLSNNTTSVEELDGEFCRKYIGGAGFIAYYLYKELKPGIDPLGPDNKLIFALGALTGVSLAGNARNCVGAKSPPVEDAVFVFKVMKYTTEGNSLIRYLSNLNTNVHNYNCYILRYGIATNNHAS